MTVGASGKVEIRTGATAQGQGVKTTLAQLCAGSLGIDPVDVSVVAGDTAAASLGLGAFASRQAVNAGSSVHLAAQEVRKKALDAASRMLEAATEDLELAGGAVHVKGVSGLSVPLGDIARVLGGMPGYAMPSGTRAGPVGDIAFRSRRTDLLQRQPCRLGRGRYRDRAGFDSALLWWSTIRDG